MNSENSKPESKRLYDVAIVCFLLSTLDSLLFLISLLSIEVGFLPLDWEESLLLMFFIAPLIYMGAILGLLAGIVLTIKLRWWPLIVLSVLGVGRWLTFASASFPWWVKTSACVIYIVLVVAMAIVWFRKLRVSSNDST